MDIERIHEMIEKLSECAKCEFDKGIENVDTAEMSEVVDMIADLSKAMYHRVLTENMLDSGTDEVMEMFDRHSKDRRYKMPYEMTVHDYKLHSPEYLRDMDRHTRGVMYYTEPLEHKEKLHESKDDIYESKYDRAKRMYTETKEIHKSNSAEDKQAKMRSLEAYMKELAEELSEIVTDMSADEKNLLRTKMQTLAQKIQ